MSLISKKELLRQFNLFKEDQTNLNKVASQKVRMLAPGFIVELFAFDMRKVSTVIDDEFYLRHTGVCKILAASEFNAQDIETHKDIKPGDICLMGDHMVVMKLNPEWETWFDMQKSPNVPPEIANHEPIKYVKGFHTLLSQGRLFLVDRGSDLVEGNNLRFGEDDIKAFEGPYTFFVDPGDILYAIENPFGDE